MTLKNTGVIIALDIETSGSRVSKNGIIAVGYYIGTIDNREIEKGTIYFNLENKEFDDDCKAQFWVKHIQKQVLAKANQFGLPPDQAIFKLISIIDRMDQIYKCDIISDNPVFDCGFINYYLDVYLNRPPLQYKLGKYHRHIVDVRSMIHNRDLWKKTKEEIRKKYPNIKHDHDPMNDATYIYFSYICARDLLIG